MPDRAALALDEGDALGVEDPEEVRDARAEDEDAGEPDGVADNDSVTVGEGDVEPLAAVDGDALELQRRKRWPLNSTCR